MSNEGPERRRGNLTYEPGSGLLVVGGRTAVLEQEAPVEALLGSYVELVVAQREVKPQSHADLRNRELVQLSALLELPQEELDALIDRELARLLGGTGAGVVAAAGWRSRRRLLLAGGLAAVGLAVGAGLAVASAADGAATGTDSLTGTGTGTGVGTGTEEIIELPDGGTATRTESAPAPVGEDGTDIGTAVVIERNP